MKKIVLSVAMIVMAVVASAQIQLGVKGGLNVSSLNGDSNGDAKASIYAGAFAEFGISDKFAIQPEVVYSRQGQTYGDPEIKMRLNYLNIPILAKYYIMDRWSVEAGPQIGIRMNAKSIVKADGTTVKTNIKEMIKGADFAIGVGTSFMILDNIGLQARYNFGISNISDVDDFKTSNNVFQFGAIFKF